MRKRSCMAVVMAAMVAFSAVGCSKGSSNPASEAPKNGESAGAAKAEAADGQEETKTAASAGEAKYVLRFGHTLTESAHFCI